MGCRKKAYASVAAVLSVRVPSHNHLPRVSYQLANDKGDNEMIPEPMHKSPVSYLMAEENPGKSQLGDCLMKAVTPVIASNGPLTSK